MLGFYALGEQALGGLTSATLTNYSLTCAGGSFAISGQAARLSFAHRVVAGAGAYTLAGNSVTLGATRKLPTAAGSFTITGQDARTLQQFVLTASELPVPTVYRRQFGFAALGEVALGEHDYIETPIFTYRIVGQSAEFRVPRILGEAGAYVVSGRDSILLHHHVLRAGVSYVVTGGAVQFSYIRRRMVGQFMGGPTLRPLSRGGQKIRGF